MTFSTYVLIIILGMALVTFIPRVFPLLFFSKYKMNKELERFIRYVPISILTALVIKEIFFIDGNLSFNLSNPNIVPAIVTLLVALKSKSIGLTIGAGLLVYILILLIF